MKYGKKIKHEGIEGYFFEPSEWTEIEGIIKGLQLEIEKAQGEAKYKLKKLSKMIERKDAKIARLTESKK
ncbi:hypothetical protein [Thalassotalea ganghwensis]